jgi:signal transduction histidine kinase
MGGTDARGALIRRPGARAQRSAFVNFPVDASQRATAAPKVPLAVSTVRAVAPNTRPARDDLLRLTAALNHQLRNPMTVLVGHCELLTTHAEALPAEQQGSIHALDDAVQRRSDAVGRACRLLHEVQARAHC